MTCPHPEKQRHRSFTAALKARDHLEANEGIDIGLRPYRCEDHWHLGHQQKPVGEAGLRRVLKRSNKPRRRA